MRSYLVASLIGHLLVVIVGSVAGRALLQPPPAMELVRVGLVELPTPTVEASTPPEPTVAEDAPAEMEEKSEPEPTEEAPVIPSPPPELARPSQEVVPEMIEAEPEKSPEDFLPAPPDPELPPAPEKEVPVREVEPVTDEEFLEPERVQNVAKETVEIEADTPAVSSAPSEEISKGAVVQATATEGLEDSYLQLVQRKIGRRWQPTPAKARGQSNVRVVVFFRIRGTGAIENVTVVESSGLSVFDREARKAILESTPLPQPPPRFGARGVEINFHFVYNP